MTVVSMSDYQLGVPHSHNWGTLAESEELDQADGQLPNYGLKATTNRNRAKLYR